MYSKSTSDLEPTGNLGNSAAKRDALMSVTAKENSDMANGTNVMEQYMTKKTSGAFGTLGKKGIGEF